MSADSLQPHYAEDFRCIGSTCEESCCEGWTVHIDKKTYQKYRSTPALRQLTAPHLERINSSGDNFKYARILPGTAKRCPFLSEDKLCRIQQQHGANFLSKTCARYPRALVRFEGKLQKGLLMSCPEAARLVLLSASPLVVTNSLESTQDAVATSNESVPQQLRRFALRLIQERNYPLWQRLFILGIVCRRAGDYTAAQQSKDIPILLWQYTGMMSRGRLRPHLDGIPKRPSLQLDLVMRLIRLRFDVEQPPDAFAQSVAEFMVGVQRSSEMSFEESAGVYAEAYTRYYEPFVRQHPGFLENYLVNYLVCSRFPFADNAAHSGGALDPTGAFLLMAFHYRLLESLLIGSAAFHREEFSAEHATRIAQSFARAVEHNVRFLEKLRNLLDASDFQQTDNLALLLRN